MVSFHSEDDGKVNFLLSQIPYRKVFFENLKTQIRLVFFRFANSGKFGFRNKSISIFEVLGRNTVTA